MNGHSSTFKTKTCGKVADLPHSKRQSRPFYEFSRSNIFSKADATRANPALAAANRGHHAVRAKEEFLRQARGAGLLVGDDAGWFAALDRDLAAHRPRVARLYRLSKDFLRPVQRFDSARGDLFRVRVDFHEPVSGRDGRSQPTLLLSFICASRSAGCG